MNLYKACIALLFSSLIVLSATIDTKHLQYIGGVLLIDSQQNLSDSIKAARYLELQKITGVTSKEALALIESYRKDPEKWKSVEDRIQKTMHTNDTLQNKK